MKLEFLDRVEDSDGRHVFKFAKGEVVDTDTDERLSLHPDPKKRIKLKDCDWDARAKKLIEIGLARWVS